MRKYVWLAHSRSIRRLLLACGVCYAGDLAAFTAASVYAYHAGGTGLVAVLGLLKALPGALLVPLLTSWADRMRRERAEPGWVFPVPGGELFDEAVIIDVRIGPGPGIA